MVLLLFFFFQAEDGIRYLVRSRGLGDVYKRQVPNCAHCDVSLTYHKRSHELRCHYCGRGYPPPTACLLYTSDAADERSSVDLGGRRIIKKKNTNEVGQYCSTMPTYRRHGTVSY